MKYNAVFYIHLFLLIKKEQGLKRCLDFKSYRFTKYKLYIKVFKQIINVVNKSILGKNS